MTGLKKPAGLLALALGLSISALAQEETSLDEIVVTGSRITQADLQDTPAIGILKPADSIVLGFQLDCDSRELSERRGELHRTLKTLLDGAKGRFTLETGAGLKIDASNYQLDLVSGSKEDSSRLYLRLRASLLDRANKANELVKQMRDYLDAAPLSGRTKHSVDSQTALNISRPERFRYELLSAVAKDVAQVRASFGPDCKVALGNLNARIQWERVSTGELFLYIPYSMDLSECAVSAKIAPQ